MFFQFFSSIINNDSFFLFHRSSWRFFQQHSQYQISNIVKKLMKMSEDIVILRRDTKNILRKFSKMEKRISLLKRRIITIKTQLKRFLFFSFFLFLIISSIFFICLILFYYHHHHHFICSFFHHHICSFSQFICAFSFFCSFVNSLVRVFFVERVDRFRI